MRYFYIKPEVDRYDSIKDFFKEFKVDKDDLILAAKVPYDSYIKPLKLSSICINADSYGEGEPKEETIDSILLDIRGKKYKRVIAIGGGSVLDIGKILALKGTRSYEDILNSENLPIKDKELILIPTTCGSGSEMTFYSAIRTKRAGSNHIIYSQNLYADYAILIPELLSTLSYNQFITCSLEALIHAAEAFVSPHSNSYTDFFSNKTIEIILMGLLKLIEKRSDFYKNLLEDFLMASNYAGIAFGNTGLAVVQALSYPLSEKYKIPHGEANYQFFTEVFKKYNNINPTGKIRLLNNTISEILQVQNNDYIYEEVQSVLNVFHPRESARKFGMVKADIQEFSNIVDKEHKRLLDNGYASLSHKDFVDLYRAAFQ